MNQEKIYYWRINKRRMLDYIEVELDYNLLHSNFSN